MKNHTITIEEGQRQLTLLALAVLTVQRPGMDRACSEIAKLMDNISDTGRPEMFDRFKEYNTPVRLYKVAQEVTLSQEDVTEMMEVVANLCANTLHDYPDKTELVGLAPKQHFFLGMLAGLFRRLVQEKEPEGWPSLDTSIYKMALARSVKSSQS